MLAGTSPDLEIAVNEEVRFCFFFIVRLFVSNLSGFFFGKCFHKLVEQVKQTKHEPA